MSVFPHQNSNNNDEYLGITIEALVGSSTNFQNSDGGGFQALVSSTNGEKLTYLSRWKAWSEHHHCKRRHGEVLSASTKFTLTITSPDGGLD